MSYYTTNNAPYPPFPEPIDDSYESDCTNTATHEPHDDCDGISDPFAGIPADEEF